MRSLRESRAGLIMAMAVLAVAGCTAAPDGRPAEPSTPPHSTTGTSASAEAASQPLAYGTFTPANGVSGNASIERADDALTLTLNSFHNGGPTARLVLVDVDPVQLADCIPGDAKTASVGGTPAEPKSVFRFASAADFAGGVVPKFRAAVLVRQATEGETGCTEPVLAVAPLTWSTGNE